MSRGGKNHPHLAASSAACDDWVDKGGGVLHVQEKQAQQGYLRQPLVL